MQVGRKAQGQDANAKLVVQRHGSKRGKSRRSYNAAEKAAETRVRQEGRKICRQYAY
jgi:hypothetical protein